MGDIKRSRQNPSGYAFNEIKDPVAKQVIQSLMEQLSTLENRLNLLAQPSTDATLETGYTAAYQAVLNAKNIAALADRDTQITRYASTLEGRGLKLERAIDGKIVQMQITALPTDSGEGDFIKCKPYSNEVLGGTEVIVAKPYLLRRTPFDGETVDGVAYTYSTNYARVANGVTQTVNPPYAVGDIINVAANPQGGTEVADGALVAQLVDLNLEGRSFQRSTRIVSVSLNGTTWEVTIAATLQFENDGNDGSQRVDYQQTFTFPQVSSEYLDVSFVANTMQTYTAEGAIRWSGNTSSGALTSGNGGDAETQARFLPVSGNNIGGTVVYRVRLDYAAGYSAGVYAEFTDGSSAYPTMLDISPRINAAKGSRLYQSGSNLTFSTYLEGMNGIQVSASIAVASLSSGENILYFGRTTSSSAAITSSVNWALAASTGGFSYGYTLVGYAYVNSGTVYALRLAMMDGWVNTGGLTGTQVRVSNVTFAAGTLSVTKVTEDNYLGRVIAVSAPSVSTYSIP